MFVLQNIVENDFISWNWYCISKHRKVTLDFILSHINDYPWNSIGLAKNPNITYELLKQNYEVLKKKICMYTFNFVKSMDFNDPNVKDYIVSYENTSVNPSLDFTFVEKNSKEDWDWESLNKHPNITSDFMYKHLDTLNLQKLVKNKNFDLYMLKNIFSMGVFKDKEWILYNIPKNPNFTMTWFDFLKNKNIDVNLEKVVQHKNTTWEDIQKYGLFSVQSISKNPNLSMNIILNNKDSIVWDWKALTIHPNITWNDIFSTKDKLPWVERSITYNKNVTIDIVKKYRTMDWDWDYISCFFDLSNENLQCLPINFKNASMNKNITMDLVHKYKKEAWDWEALGANLNIM
jgi:hypothetical protein